MRVFLTGGSGFLGRWIAERCVAEQLLINALVRRASRITHLDQANIQLHHGDLTDLASLVRAMQGCDTVIHVASPKGGWRHPTEYTTHTITGTHNLLAAMSAAGVRRLIAISTISVHGVEPISEVAQGRHRVSDGPNAISAVSPVGRRFLPHDYYGQAKAISEQMIVRAHQRGVVQASVLRIGWLYGPYDERSYGRLADRMRRGMLVRVGDGTNHIPLVYAPNVAELVWSVLSAPAPTEPRVLYASDGAISQNDLLDSLMRASGRTRPLPSISRRVLHGFAQLQEWAAVRSGYRLPVIFSRYFLHLIGSNWQFAANPSADFPRIAAPQGFATTETWYRESRVLAR